MSLSIYYWLIAFSPVMVLLAGILLFKWEAPRAGAVSWFVAIAAAGIFFGADGRLLALANSKGISLSLYVLLIIWAAIFLYHIAAGAGAIGIIGRRMQQASDDRLTQCLLLSWCFASLLQGIAGFGVPVAVVAPIMAAMGFEPVTAVAACLVGHSWSISFGSMGSSYNAIQLVTKIPGDVIGPVMATVFSVAIFSTGFSVAHIHSGMSGLKRAFPMILGTGAVMSAALWFMNRLGVAQIATLVAGMSGCVVLSLWAYLKKEERAQEPPTTSASAGEISLHAAAAPYYAVVLITLLLQIPAVKRALSPYFWALSYPAVSTSLGHHVGAAANYSKILLFAHPAPILLLSALFGALVYAGQGNKKFARAQLAQAAKATAGKCVPTSVGIATMVMMALVMSDSGMTNYIARGVAALCGRAYPMAAPFVGALGTFITGSNTNSNVMFGVMQYETATVLGISGVLMASAQSVGGSLGVAIAPSTILMGASNVGAQGRESEILGRTLRYGIGNIALVGLFVWLLTRWYV